MPETPTYTRGLGGLMIRVLLNFKKIDDVNTKGNLKSFE